jgi:hypothetical protein
MSAPNSSCMVARFTALQAGNPWAGFEIQHGNDLGGFVLDSTNCIINIMVWKPVISNVGIKLATPTNAAMIELKVPNTIINKWEMLTFDFSSYIGQYPYNIEMVDQIVIFLDIVVSSITLVELFSRILLFYSLLVGANFTI